VGILNPIVKRDDTDRWPARSLTVATANLLIESAGNGPPDREHALHAERHTDEVGHCEK
jgi:hypothetical protein